MAVSANRLELLQIVDAVAREKSIDRAIVLASMEDAMQKAARSRYGQETDVHAEINPKTGEIRFTRHLLVVDRVENDAIEISLVDAQRKNPSAQIGDMISESLPPFDYGRIPAQASKQVLVQKIREAERDKQYEVFKDRIGDIINGAVKRVEYGNVVVDLGGAGGEAVVRRDELIPREMFRPGDRIRAYVYDVRREARGPQIFLSRTHPQFTAKLFTQEVPEIYDGIVEVRAVARDPGSRAKIAVTSNDSSIDPVGACVGMRGSRVQAVVNELQGEKIDIIPWSPDAATFIVNALQPAEVMKVVLDEDSTRIEVVVPDDQLSLAIGRRGQNVRLASQLTGWDIDILTEAEESERRQKEFAERTTQFMDALDVDETVAQLLASEGFRTVEEIAYVEPRELAPRSRDSTRTRRPRSRRARRMHLAAIEAELDDKRKALGVADELKEIEGLTTAMLVKLGENGVKSLEDLADCASDDLVGWTEGRFGQARLPQRLRRDPRAGRRHDPGRARPRGLDRGARARAGRRGRTTRKARRPERGLEDFGLRSRERTDDGGSERTCIATGAKGPPEAMLRFALGPDGAVVPDIRRKLPGRGVWTSLSAAAVRRASAKGAFARAFRAKAEAAGRSGGRRGRASRARRAAVAGDGQQGGTGRRRRVQGGRGDRSRRGRRPDSGLRRRGGRRGQTRTGAEGAARRGLRSRRPDQSLLFKSIGFGIGEGKCDTCCAQIRRGDLGLPDAGRAAAPFSRGRGGRGSQNRRRRRAGRKCDGAWPSGRIG